MIHQKTIRSLSPATTTSSMGTIAGQRVSVSTRGASLARPRSKSNGSIWGSSSYWLRPRFYRGKGKKEAKAEARDRAFRDEANEDEDEAADEAPEDEAPEDEALEFDADLLEIAEGAPPSVMEALHAEQKRRNEGKPLPLLDPSPLEPEDDNDPGPFTKDETHRSLYSSSFMKED